MKYYNSQLAISTKKVYSIRYKNIIEKRENYVLHNYDKRRITEGICLANRAF